MKNEMDKLEILNEELQSSVKNTSSSVDLEEVNKLQQQMDSLTRENTRLLDFQKNNMDLVKQYKKEIEDLEKNKKTKQEDIVSDYRNRLEDANSLIEKQNSKISNLQKDLAKKDKELTSTKNLKSNTTTIITNDDLPILEQTMLFIIPEHPKFNNQLEKGVDERIYDLYQAIEKYKYLEDDHTILTRIIKLLKRNLDDCKSSASCAFWLRQLSFLIDKISAKIGKENITNIHSLLGNKLEIAATDDIYDLDHINPNQFMDYLRKIGVSFFCKQVQIVLKDTKTLLFTIFFEKVIDRKRYKKKKKKKKKIY